jgi:hypothetical protein
MCCTRCLLGRLSIVLPNHLLLYSSLQAFVDGIVATWYIPYWSSLKSFATEYQGMPAYEGFYRQEAMLRLYAQHTAQTCVTSFNVAGRLQARSNAAIVLSLQQIHCPVMPLLAAPTNAPSPAAD